MTGPRVTAASGFPIGLLAARAATAQDPTVDRARSLAQDAVELL